MADHPAPEPDMTNAADRYRLPISQVWTYSHGGQVTDVSAGFSEWPMVLVILGVRGTGMEMRGAFDENGRLWQVILEAKDGQREISTADLRWPAMTHSLKSWEIVAREAARQILNGIPEREIVLNALSATQALRALAASASQRRPAARTRGSRREDLLRQVAAAYRKAVTAEDPHPRETLAARFGYSPAHIGRLLVDARKPRNGQPPLLGPASPGRAGELATV